MNQESLTSLSQNVDKILIINIPVSIKQGYYINTSNNEATNESFGIGECEVLPNKSISLKLIFATGTNGIVTWWYDENKIFLSRTTSEYSSKTANIDVLSPDNAKYMRFNIGSVNYDKVNVSYLDAVYKIDNTLSVSASPADSKTTGERIAEVNNRFNTIMLPNNVDLNDYTTYGSYIVPSSYNISNRPNTATCLLEVYGASNGYVVQRYSTLTSEERVYIRRKSNGTSGSWSAWIQLNNAVQLKNNDDINDYTEYGYYIVPSAYTILNRPSSITSLLEVMQYGSSYIVQRYTTVGSSNLQIYVRRMSNGTWGEWSSLSENADSNQYNYEINNYQNSVNITANPSIEISADYYLKESDDPTVDRTSEILALLTTNGYCKLGKGTFVVSGLVMPDNSKLEGSGFGTVLVMPSSVTEGFIVSVRNYCLLSDLKLSGGSSSYMSEEDSGTRHGVIFQGSLDQSGTPVNVPRNSCINNIWAENFSGAGLLCQYTGTASIASLTVNDIWINGCYIGINIFRRSEYSHFTNCKVLSNHVGLINNGGNNFFVNCDFSRNITNVVMDNSDGEAYNNTHGSMVSCSINHANSNNGDAIVIKGMTNGFVFEGCNIFFGKIDISDSEGIEFANMNIGSMYHVTVDNSKCILFLGCMFNASPTFNITDSIGVIVDKCYLRSTGETITI